MNGNRALTRDEVRRIMELKISERDKALFAVMVYCATRVSETLSLRIGDVSDSRGNIHNYLVLQAKATKTHKGASILLNSIARKLLAKHVKNLLAMGLTMDDALFGGRVGQYKKPITRQAAHSIFKKIYEMARVVGGKLACHAPRKTAVAQIYSKTKNLLTCKAVLRHRSINSTMAYLDSCLHDVNEAFLKLSY